MTVFPYM
jgi:Na+/melibiose symporter-like transporter